MVQATNLILSSSDPTPTRAMPHSVLSIIGVRSHLSSFIFAQEDWQDIMVLQLQYQLQSTLH